MAWEFHAPSGTYRNHALSSKIRMEAAADSQFIKYLPVEPGFGKGRGDTVTITRILQLPLAGRVSETQRLPSGRPAISTKSVEVSEWGFKTEMTEKELNLTHYQIQPRFRRMLRDQMRLTMDKMGADALKQTPYKYIPTVTGGVFDTDGTASTTADANMGVNDVRNIKDELQGQLKAPPYRNGLYIGLLSTRAARGIKNDPEYKDWHAPTSSEPLRTSGRGARPFAVIEDIALFEVNHYDALDNDIGSNDVLGEAVFFGDDAGFLATVDDPEVRMGIPEDLGRFRQMGWVGTIEAGLTWELAEQARVIHVTSQ